MSNVEYIVWHCTATPAGRDLTIEHVRDWHINGNGWLDVGYHYLIRLDGTIEEGRPLDDDHDLAAWERGAHVRGLNSKSIGVCYVGGLDGNGRPKDTRTQAQKRALYDLTARLLIQFPNARVAGHSEFANKACPSFDAAADWAAHQDSIATRPARRPLTRTSTGQTGAAGILGTGAAAAVALSENAADVLDQATNPAVQSVVETIPWAATVLAGVAVAAIVLMLVRKSRSERGRPMSANGDYR